jgi:histidine triad (HIT) family protein
MENCLFCRIISKEIPSSVVYEDEDILAFNDITPQAPVHILLIPKRHISSTEEITEDNKEIAGKIIAAASLLAKQKGLEGYRLVFNSGESAGQSVFHLHCHLLGGRNFSWPPG